MSHQDTPGPERVLVVDDHRTSRQFTVAALRQKGCTVKQAASLQNGLKTALEWLPAAVITDWNLGDGNGGELLCLIRSRWPQEHGLPRFALLTGETKQSLPRSALETGFDLVLHKPCSADDLSAFAALNSESYPGTAPEPDADIPRLFRAELRESMKILDRLIADRRLAEAADITHRLVTGGVLCRSRVLGSALRRLDAACRDSEAPARVANDWCRARSAACDWLAGVQQPRA